MMGRLFIVGWRTSASKLGCLKVSVLGLWDLTLLAFACLGCLACLDAGPSCLNPCRGF